MLRLLQADHGKFSLPLGEDVPLPGVGAVELGFQMDREALRVSAILGGCELLAAAPVLDATLISHDRCCESGALAFTGAFAALFAHDDSDVAPPADFDWFRYVATQAGSM